MHELPVTEDIMRIVTEHAERAKASRIVEITIVVGDMSSFIDDSIQFYFDLLSPGTLAEGAALVFKRIPVRFRCRSCQHEFEPDRLDWRCPQCGNLGGAVIAGKEFFVESIEVV